jgi:hypothetical protein
MGLCSGANRSSACVMGDLTYRPPRDELPRRSVNWASNFSWWERRWTSGIPGKDAATHIPIVVQEHGYSVNKPAAFG